MMPQKKNPDVLELSRGKTGQIIGNMIDLIINLKALPMTYDRDLQEDKRGLWSSIDTVESIIKILIPLLSAVEVNQDLALKNLTEGYALATDIAEYLVMKNVPFREAHLKVGKLVGFCVENNLKFQDLNITQWKNFIPEFDEELLKILTPEQSIKRRNIYGATSPEQIKLQISEGHERLKSLI